LATGTIANGENASFELGQPSGGTAFTTLGTAVKLCGMNLPTALAYDSANTLLYVADTTNNRARICECSALNSTFMKLMPN
jgi:hypothetical protein